MRGNPPNMAHEEAAAAVAVEDRAKTFNSYASKLPPLPAVIPIEAPWQNGASGPGCGRALIPRSGPLLMARTERPMGESLNGFPRVSGALSY